MSNLHKEISFEEMLGLRKPLQIAQFRPALAINAEILAAARPTGSAVDR